MAAPGPVNVLAEIVGDSAGITRLRGQLAQILTRAASALRPPPVLLRGETGTGKGLVARTMHRAGPRARGPFVDVNCAAIPETLLEAELFGFERGAFTDARQAKPGLFQLAHRGTLFLDEIGMLSPALQAKLLKVLEDGVVRRLGGTRAEPVDVWIVSATNEDLAEAQRERRFREDLYHRLAVLTLELPPLRERGSDILLLAERFLARACADYGLPPKTFASDARASLTAYAWPGNVRELGNIVERVALLADGPKVTTSMLALPTAPPAVAEPGPGPEPAAGRSSRDQMRVHLLEVLTETSWNISQTAVRLGVARNTVLARMARFGFTPVGSHAAERRAGGRPRRDATPPAQTGEPASRGATAKAVWEPRRIALLRVDVAAATAAGSADASPVLDDVVGKAEAFGGEVVELGLSAFVAAFGLDAIEDAPVRAALAALAILKARERAQSAGERQRVKIVIHVAHALVTRVQGTATIDLESKRAAWATIEALAALDALDSIVASESSVPFLERRFELVSPTALEAGPIAFRRLTRQERTGFGLGGRPLTPFVGRETELAVVGERLAQAADGHGQVVAVVGEPGVGKSRMIHEVTIAPYAAGWRVVGSSGVSHGTATPFLPFGELLRRYFAIEDGDASGPIRDKVIQTINRLPLELGAHLTPLLALLDVPVDDPKWQGLHPSQRRLRMQDAVKLLLLAESRLQPLLVILEDLHWIDAHTQALLDGLINGLPTARIVLLASFRPEYEHRWGGKTYYTQLRIDPLADASAATLLRSLLGADPSLHPLARLLTERTEGNPLFLEECVQALVETRALVGERGAYRMTGSIETVQLPATVQAVLAARIERLALEDKRLLQSAAVIGRHLPLSLLAAIDDRSDDELRHDLDRLIAAEFLYEKSLLPEPEYTFKHALTQEAVYAGVPQETRRGLHARIVDVLERFESDHLTEQLAHHASRAELWHKAVRYVRKAGARASQRSAHPEAVALLEQALEALGRVPGGQETDPGFDRDALELDLRIDLGVALSATAGYTAPEWETNSARLLELHERTGEMTKLFPVLWGQWVNTFSAGKMAPARAMAERILDIAERHGERVFVMVGHRVLGMSLVGQARLATARAHLERAIELYDPERDPPLANVYAVDQRISAMSYLAVALIQLGESDHAVSLMDQTIAEATRLHGANTTSFVLSLAVCFHILGGDRDRLAGVASELASLSQKHGLAVREVVARTVIALLAARRDAASSLDEIGRGIDELRAVNWGFWTPWLLLMEAEVHIDRAAPAAARARLDEVDASITPFAYDLCAPELHRLRALALLVEGAGAERARPHLERSIDLARHQSAGLAERRAREVLDSLP